MKYLLKEISEGEIREELTFNNFVDLKEFLIQNTNAYFGWINDEEPDKVLPDFNAVESLREIVDILNDYDYSWWSVEVEEVNEFTNLLRQKRLEQGLTQVQVSEALGFNPNYYQQIELGNKLPSFGTLIKLAKILDVTLGELEILKSNLYFLNSLL